MEIWRDISGYEGLYQVSNWGRVKSLERIDNNNHLVKEKIIKPGVNKGGYLYVTICKNGKRKEFRVNRLVYETFVGEIPEGLQCNHINEMKEDNSVENINLMTPKENVNWGTRNKRIGEAQTNRSDQSKPVLQIDKNTNEIIAKFLSTREVQRQLGFSNTHISDCCNGKQKTAYGYKWQFKNG